MSRQAQPLFLRVSIGLGLATAALTSTARADPAMLAHLGIGVAANPAWGARPGVPVLVPRAGRGAPVTLPAATTAPQIGTPVTEVTARSRRPDGKHQAGAATTPADGDDLTAILAAVKAERSSWAEVQELLKEQPAIADTPIYREIAQFQETLRTMTDPATTGTSAKDAAAKDAAAKAPLAGQTRKQRNLLLQNLTTQNVVMQTLIEQVSAAHLDGWRVSGQNSARWPGESAPTASRHLLA